MNQDTTPAPFALLDLDLLSQFVDPQEGIGFFRNLLLDVIAETPGHLEAISRTLLRGDESEFRAQAHALRGVLANHGCSSIAELLKDFELSMPAADQAEASLAALTDIWEHSRAALLLWLETHWTTE